MRFEEWVAQMPEAFKNDPLWSVSAYRLATYLSYLAGNDVGKLARDARTQKVASQLYRAVGSIGANIAEGYSRYSLRDQARLYEYALGSAREARHWYYQAHIVLGEDIITHRFHILTHITRLLLKMIPTQRANHVAEEPAPYLADLPDIPVPP